jgi:type III pantothenate kinase
VLLAIDVGNTEITIGVFEGQELAQHWRAATVAERTADEHALLLGGFLGQEGLGLADADGVVISSVVPRLTQALREMVRRYCQVEPLVIEPGVRTGLPILTDNPREVGADRVVNAIAAHAAYGGPVVVVDFGTATTFDAVSERGEHLGAAIAPGIQISMNALVERTAQLRRVELVRPRSVIGKNTVESLQAGAIWGFAGQVDGIVRRMVAELGGTATVVATGGLAGAVLEACETVQRHEPWLTLHGLRIIWDRNWGSGGLKERSGRRPESRDLAAPVTPPDGGGLADRWLLSRLEHTRAAVTTAYEEYDPAEAARLLFAFSWSELADWAVELAKPRLAAGGEGARQAATTLTYALDVVVRLLHPVMPFVTEELARAFGADTIVRGPWPAERPGDRDPKAEEDMAALQEAITAVRRFRAEHQVPPSRHPRLTVVPAGTDQGELFRAEAESMRRLARLETVEVGPAPRDAGPTAKLRAAGAELYLPLAGLLDLDEERGRLRRELATLESERSRAVGKLANPAFVEKAPAAVVDKARARLAEVDQARAKVEAQLAELD